MVNFHFSKHANWYKSLSRVRSKFVILYRQLKDGTAYLLGQYLRFGMALLGPTSWLTVRWNELIAITRTELPQGI